MIIAHGSVQGKNCLQPPRREHLSSAYPWETSRSQKNKRKGQGGPAENGLRNTPQAAGAIRQSQADFQTSSRRGLQGSHRTGKCDNGPCAKQEHPIVPDSGGKKVPRVLPWAAADMHDMFFTGTSVN